MSKSLVAKAGLYVLAGFLFFLVAPHALASQTGFEFMYFRIDTELNVLNDKGVTVVWTCNGSGQGSITDATASESTNSQDGIVKLASTSAENSTANAGCDSGEAITATVSLSGWVTRTWSGTVSASTSNGETNPFTTRASMDYNLAVTTVKDELANSLTLNGTTASVSYSGTTASASYSSGVRYFAATATGTLTGGGDGYVNQTVSVTSVSLTASGSAGFGSSGLTYNGSGLPFSTKINLNGMNRFGSTTTNLSGATVTAGNSGGISCSESSGVYYCAVPIGHTGVTATTTASTLPIGGLTTSLTCTYTDRDSGDDSQSTCTITATEPPVGGGGGGTVVTPTPTPTPTPTTSPSPTDTPTPTPTPTTGTPATPASHGFVNLANLGIHEGDVISSVGSEDPDIYIPNEHGYKRLFLNPVIFGFYGHLGGFNKVKNTTSVTRDVLVTSGLFRNCETDDQKVYGLETTGEDTGKLHWVNTSGAQAVADDPDFFKKVFCINSNESDWYSKGEDYTSVNQVPSYMR